MPDRQRLLMFARDVTTEWQWVGGRTLEGRQWIGACHPGAQNHTDLFGLTGAVLRRTTKRKVSVRPTPEVWLARR